jgi:hypothetical protein
VLQDQLAQNLHATRLYRSAKLRQVRQRVLRVHEHAAHDPVRSRLAPPADHRSPGDRICRRRFSIVQPVGMEVHVDDRRPAAIGIRLGQSGIRLARGCHEQERR